MAAIIGAADQPRSSPVKAMNSTRRGSFSSASWRATSIKAAAPDALSSAPLWISFLSGARDPSSCPPQVVVMRTDNDRFVR